MTNSVISTSRQPVLRHHTAPIEPVVQADAHDVGLLATSIDDYARAREGTDEGPSVAAEIGEEVLGLDAPIVEEGVFNTCTHG